MPVKPFFLTPVSRSTFMTLPLCMVLALFSTTSLASQADIALQVSPERCISLHPGQVCYQQLTFSWKTPNDGEYCLYEQNLDTPLVCWVGNSQTQYRYEFEAAQTMQYSLKQKHQQQQLASVKVQVASVYRAPKKSTSNWRLF